jgi:serine/threonine protein phosphatase PrpC/nucleotide-binding universal stress UspA family protein
MTDFEANSNEDFCVADVRIRCAGLTDVGRQRETNEDNFLIADLRKNFQVQASSFELDGPYLFGDVMGKLLFVADGMGGANAGEVASEMTIHSTAKFLLNSMHWLFHPNQPEIERFVHDLKSAARFSHLKVREDSQRDPEHHGMGSTLTVAYLIWPMLYVLHVGDSRCYVIHEDKLELLTKDQTLAQFLLESGQISEEDFDESPFQQVLMSAIGTDYEPETVVFRQRLSIGDRVLICSDGVNAHLDDEEIGEILKMDLSPDQIGQEIIDQANSKGGRDNITTVVMCSEPLESPASSDGTNRFSSNAEDLSILSQNPGLTDALRRKQMKLHNTDKVIVVPWDFSDLSREALEKAFEMVENPALIRVIHVTQYPTPYEYGIVWDSITEESISEKVGEAFRSALSDDERFNDVQLSVMFGDPGKRICDFAEELEAELIIMPSHGRSGFSRIMLGSVAERVVRFAHCPVLILRDTAVAREDQADN